MLQTSREHTYCFSQLAHLLRFGGDTGTSSTLLSLSSGACRGEVTFCHKYLKCAHKSDARCWNKGTQTHNLHTMKLNLRGWPHRSE